MDITSLLPQRTEVIKAHKETGGAIAAVLPVHYPRAMFRAFNLLPVEVWGPPRIDPTQGAIHLQPYVCSIVRNALSFLLTGGLDVADVIVVPHACDSLQGLGSILLDFISPRQTVIPLYLPRGRRESDAAFLADELRLAYKRLSSLTGCAPDDTALLECIYREEMADALLMQLHTQRCRLPCTDFELYRLIRSREYLPAERFVELARAALAGASDQSSRGIPILLSGIVLEPMSVLDSINDMGGTIGADDLACCGRRLYPAGTSLDPFCRMSESILSAPPDPMRGSSITERRDYLLQLAKGSGARGVLFYDVKFCEPELFDLPDLRRELQAEGLPSIAVEVDLNDPLSHVVMTRIEAFLEMIA